MSRPELPDRDKVMAIAKAARGMQRQLFECEMLLIINDAEDTDQHPEFDGETYVQVRERLMEAFDRLEAKYGDLMRQVYQVLASG